MPENLPAEYLHPLAFDSAPEDPAAAFVPLFHVVRPLGEGAHGEVLLARDELLGREVALKLLTGELREVDASAWEALRYEARAMARVRHPAVVTVLDIGRMRGRPCVVMEYVRGETLQGRLDREPLRLLALGESFHLLAAIASGIAALHDAGLAHGDLQPGNILIGDDYRVRVSDFGLAAWGLHDTSQGRGSPHYLAPELQPDLLQGEPMLAARQRADIYAFGVLAFELFGGERPFEAPDTARIMVQHRYKAPPSLLALRPELGARTAGLVERCLSKDPADRPPHVHAVLQELKRGVEQMRQSSYRRLLIVDDDPALRSLVRAYVQEWFPGVRCSEAGGGEEALALFRREPADVVVVDLHMPGDQDRGLNGVELTASLRTETRVPRLVVLSGKASAGDWALLRSLGAEAFVAKPLDPAALEQALSRLLFA